MVVVLSGSACRRIMVIIIVTLVRLRGRLIYIVLLTDLFFLWDFDLLLDCFVIIGP